MTIVVLDWVAAGVLALVGLVVLWGIYAVGYWRGANVMDQVWRRELELKKVPRLTLKPKGEGHE